MMSWRREENRPGRFIAVAVAILAWVMTACGTGDDAVQQGDSFEFVSPGGQTVIFYDPPDSRGQVGELMGPDLLDDNSTIRLSDFAGQVVVINVWGPGAGHAAERPQPWNKCMSRPKTWG